MNRPRQREREIQRQRERQQNNDMMTEGVVLMSLWSALLTFWFQNDLGRENSASHLKYKQGRQRLFTFFTIVTRWSRSTSNFLLWLVKIWQVSSCSKFILHLETCLLWHLKLTEFFCRLVMFFTVFFHWMHKMKYSCYQQSSVIHGWFVYWICGWEMRRLSSRKSDFGWLRFRFSPCWMLVEKSLERFWPYLMAFRSCISNGKPE